MTAFDELVARIGRARYDQACGWAWRTAAGTGDHRAPKPWPEDLDAVPHEIADLWYDDGREVGEVLDAALRVYTEMPCYANTMELNSHVSELSSRERDRLWSMYRSALNSDDDRLADPVAYSLWVDFFEDQQTVAEAWHESSRRDLAPWERRVRRLLEVAGPVPWYLKEQLFDELAGDADWHPGILRALVGSAFDSYGQIDAQAAKGWLSRLQVADGTPDLVELRHKLDAG